MLKRSEGRQRRSYAPMPKRLLFALGILVLAVVACHSGAAAPTPTAGPTATPTPNPVASTATIDVTYNGSAYLGTVYANAAPSGCPASTTIGGSTATAIASPPPDPSYEYYGVANFSNLTPDTYYIFFITPGGGGTISTQCTLEWSYSTIDLSGTGP
jgi:hypothetical protein